MLSSHTIAKRWRLPALLASLSLLAGLALQPVIAAKPVSPTFVDYAQCANEAPPSTDLDCLDGWINGILQASNSHYSEDQVTPQRAEVNVPAGASTDPNSHSMTFTYQTRKGSAQTHAYDSLATWNWTQTAADRCDGLADNDCVGGDASTYPIPDDTTALEPHTAPSGTNTATHMLPASTQEQCDDYATTIPSRCFEMYGGFIDSVSPYTHSCTATGDCLNPSVDDYATITIFYHPASVPAKVQLLFGGHLAVGSEGGPRTWGLGNGASDISGGPYHIKWDAADGSSIGNRDNQIMGSAIIFNDSSTATQVKNTNGTADTANDTNIANDAHVSLGTVAYDTATLSGTNSATAGGTVTYYYSSVATCDPLAVTTTTIGSVTVTNGIVPASATVTLSTAGTYEFFAVYSGDATHGGSASTCGSETVIVDKAAPSFVTQASPTTSIVVGTNTTVGDTATFTGGYGIDGQSVSFALYTTNTAGVCSGAVSGVSGSGTISSGVASYSTSWTPTTPGTYYWRVSYAGDSNNDAYGPICGGTNETLTVIKASPSFVTQASPTTSIVVGTETTVGDTATFTGGYSIDGGTVSFTLYTTNTAGVCSGAVAGVSGSGTIASGVASYSTSWTPTALGTYYWGVSYAGDANNNGFGPICGGANETLTVIKASPGGTTQPAAQIRDTFTITGGYNPSGTVTFSLWTGNTCTTGQVGTDDADVALTGGSATSKWYSIVSGTTYYWKAVYSGDSLNNGKTVCGEASSASLSTSLNP